MKRISKSVIIGIYLEMKEKYFKISYCTSVEINDFSRKLMDLKDIELLVASDYDEEKYFQFDNGVFRFSGSNYGYLKGLMSYSYIYLFPLYEDKRILRIFLQTVKSGLLREKSCVYENLNKIEQMESSLSLPTFKK